ncbi:hypothetical protein HMPREF3198_02125 [Winkia neuii]|nr:hypothetical protein HMPREF3198_02125 [Winkia neuii]
MYIGTPNRLAFTGYSAGLTILGRATSFEIYKRFKARKLRQ